MYSLNRLTALIATGLVLLSAGCATTGHSASASNFPVGKYSNGDTVAIFNPDGTFTGTTTSGDEWVRGTYTHTADEFTMIDTWEGPMLTDGGNGCEGQPGRYRWSLTGDVLIATAIEDSCAGRKQGTSGVAWTRMQ